MSMTSIILFILIVWSLFLRTWTGVGIRNDSLMCDLSAHAVQIKRVVRDSENLVNMRLSVI